MKYGFIYRLLHDYLLFGFPNQPFYSGFFAHCVHIYSALRKSLKKQQQSLWKSFLHYTLLMYYTYVHFLHLLIHTYSKSSSSAERIFFLFFCLKVCILYACIRLNVYCWLGKTIMDQIDRSIMARIDMYLYTMHVLIWMSTLHQNVYFIWILPNKVCSRIQFVY